MSRVTDLLADEMLQCLAEARSSAVRLQVQVAMAPATDDSTVERNVEWLLSRILLASVILHALWPDEEVA